MQTLSCSVTLWIMIGDLYLRGGGMGRRWMKGVGVVFIAGCWDGVGRARDKDRSHNGFFFNVLLESPF